MTWHRPNSPAGPVTSAFGSRGPVRGAPAASRFHLGVDLRAGTHGVPVDIYAAAGGTVRRIYRTPLGAWVLEVDHGTHVWTRYAHMQRTGIHVAVGQHVTTGQHVADASSSGASTVHLHFETLVAGAQVDPVPWMLARGVDLTRTGGVPAATPPAPAPEPAAPDVQEDDMLIIRRAHDGAAFLVLGGRGARLLGPDLATIAAVADTVNVSDAQYAILEGRYLRTA